MDLTSFGIREGIGNLITRFSSPAITQKETSSYRSQYYDKSYMAPYNPDDLVSRKGLDIYDEMIKKDDQVKACLFLKVHSVLSSGWEIEAAGDSPREEEHKEFLEYVLSDGMKGNFLRDLFEITKGAYGFGFSVSEKVYQPIDVRKFRNKVGLKYVKNRPPHGFKFDTDDYGNLKKNGFIQETTSGQKFLNPNKHIIFSYNSEYGNYYGNSDLRACYRYYYSKDIIIRFWNVFLERFGMPTVIGKHKKGTSTKDKDNLRDIIKHIQAKTGITVPDSIEFELLEATRRGDAGYKDAIEVYNKAIARSMLIPDLLGFSDTKGGSYALGKEQGDIYTLVLGFLRQEIEELIHEQVGRDLITFNYGEQESYPRFKFRPYTEDDKYKMADIIIRAKEKELFRITEEDEEHMRTIMGLPKITQQSRLLSVGKTVSEAEKDRKEREDNPPIPPQGPGGNNPDGTGSKGAGAGKGPGEGKEDGTGLEPHSERQRINLKEVESDMDEMSKAAVDEGARIMEDILESAINYVSKKKVLEDNNIKAVKEFTINVGALKRMWKHYLREMFDRARMQAKKAIEPEQFAVSKSYDLPPAKAIEWLNTYAFEIAAVTKNDAEKVVKQIMLDGLEQGSTHKDVSYKLEGAFNKYIKGKVRPDKTLEPYHLQTIANTTFTKAYNMGLKTEYESTDYVIAYEYEATLDGDTTDYCRSMHGEIFMKNDPRLVFPPAHHNCRSILIPIFKDDKYELSKRDPQKGRPEQFGGKE